MGIPKKHKTWVRWFYQGNEYVTTTLGEDRSKYYMWKKIGNTYEQLGTSASPKKLEEKVLGGKW